jgi:hypothetical protein
VDKVQLLLWKPAALAPDAFRETLRALMPSLAAIGVQRWRLAVVDSAVDAARGLRMEYLQPPPQACCSVWLDDAQSGSTALLSELAFDCERSAAYLVTEAVPLADDPQPVAPGQRCYGMNQVVLLRRPQWLSEAKWLDIWQGSHTSIAIDTQSTFGYRQNRVLQSLSPAGPDIDAIVEENFPPEAMTSPTAFYAADDDQERLQQRIKTMIESCQRFIEFDQLDCLPMSEYRSSTDNPPR